MVLRAANQDQNDCRWQSYHNLLAVERSETDEDRRNVPIMNAVRKEGTIWRAILSVFTAVRVIGCRRSSSDLAYARPPSPEGKAFPRQIPIYLLADYT